MEVLTCDWSKYNENIIVSGSVDKSIRVWVSKPAQIIIMVSGLQCSLLFLTGYKEAIGSFVCAAGAHLRRPTPKMLALS